MYVMCLIKHPKTEPAVIYCVRTAFFRLPLETREIIICKCWSKENNKHLMSEIESALL